MYKCVAITEGEYVRTNTNNYDKPDNMNYVPDEVPHFQEFSKEQYRVMNQEILQLKEKVRKLKKRIRKLKAELYDSTRPGREYD